MSGSAATLRFGVALTLLACGVLVASANCYVYVATEGGDIARLQLDTADGSLHTLGNTLCAPLTMHLAVSPDRQFLYAAARKEPWQVVSFAIDARTGDLSEISRVESPANFCYIACDRAGKYLLGADYANGRVAVLAIEGEGKLLAEPAQVLETSLYAHSILTSPNNRFAYVPQLGNARVSAFHFDAPSGRLRPASPPFYYAKQSSGPRHQVFHPNGKLWYLSSELDGLVYAYQWDAETGLLNEIQRIRGLPADSPLAVAYPPGDYGPPPSERSDAAKIWMADIHITPDGKWLYASERGSGTIAAFAVDGSTGRLTYIDNYATEPIPRGFNIDPSGSFLLVAGQVEDGHVQVHAIDPAKGNLTSRGRYAVGVKPNWIECVELP